VRCWIGDREISSRVLDATLTTSGANEGDVGVVAGTQANDANTVVVSTNNTPSVTAQVTHTDSGSKSPQVPFGADLPGYSGGIGK